MTPEELKQIAIEASKHECEKIKNEMNKAANRGSFTCKFESISDGAVHQLRKEGFQVNVKTKYTNRSLGMDKEYFEVQLEK